MSSSLSFVPRKLAKKSTTTPRRIISQVVPAPSASTTFVPSPKPTEHEKSSKYNDTDYANLVALALSDYALWVDADLRQRLAIDSQQSPWKDAVDGYVSLNHLFERSAVLASALDERPSQESSSTARSKIQTELAKAIRTHTSHLFNVRLLLHSDNIVPRFGKQKEVGGGYEIGRKRKGLVMRGKAEWDACTLYIENIPPGYRSYAGILQFLGCLLHDTAPSSSLSASSADPFTHVQGIAFPPHHNDQLDARPSCKGFALVTFTHLSDCEHLLNHWSWLRAPKEDAAETGPSESLGGKELNETLEAIHEARRFNFRTITKQRWLELKAEYLAYRQKLVDEINGYQDAQEKSQIGARQQDQPMPRTDADTPPTSSGSQEDTGRVEPPLRALIDPSASYPPDCLVFVKHVHPETTKTTLRHLFGQAFGPRDGSTPSTNIQGLNYVDFNKGMDTCYLRLASPTHTSALMSYFTSGGRRIAQVSGLDETGTDLPSSADVGNLVPIVMERVSGKPEGFYWEKVPVKIRRAAVEEAVKSLDGSNGSAEEGRKRQRSTGDGREGDENLKKRRKQWKARW